MKIEEAKAEIEAERGWLISQLEGFGRAERETRQRTIDALDLVMWLCDWHAAVKAGADMIAWERDNPQP